MTRARLKVVLGHKMVRKVELGIRMRMTQHLELAPAIVIVMMSVMIPIMALLTQCIKNARTTNQTQPFAARMTPNTSKP